MPAMTDKSAARAQGELRYYSAAPEPAAESRAAVEPAPMAEAPARLAGNAGERPEDWLARIKQLKQQGRLDEARKELAAFRKRYPGRPVPKEIDLQ